MRGEKTAATCRVLLEGEEHLWTFLRVRDRADEQRGGAGGFGTHAAVAEIERRDGKRVGAAGSSNAS